MPCKVGCYGRECSRYRYTLAELVFVLQCYSDQMVTFTGAAPSLIAPSVTYLKIRAWSAPAVLISMVAQVRLSALYLRTFPGCAMMLPMLCLLLSRCL